jgi:hypothetical protein
MTADQKLRLDPSPHERHARQYAERVYRTLVALEPLYDVNGGIEWLTSRQESLGGDMAAYLLSLHSGTEKVQQVIAQILDGAFV